MTKAKFIEKICPILSRNEFSGWSLKDKVFSVNDNLTDDERDLFFQLFLKYTIIKMDRYQHLFFSLLKKLDSDSIMNNCHRLFFYPIIDIDRPNTFKSGHFLFEFLNSLEFSYLSIFNNIDITLRGLTAEKAEQTDYFVFIDDFIGSGNQALKHIKSVSLQYNIKPKNIIILTLAIMSVGYNMLSQQQYNILYCYKLNKAISEDMPEDKRRHYLPILDDMENRFGVPNNYKRGYGKCEGLISLRKTPNNTLPIFWHQAFSENPIFPRRISKK